MTLTVLGDYYHSDIRSLATTLNTQYERAEAAKAAANSTDPRARARAGKKNKPLRLLIVCAIIAALGMVAWIFLSPLIRDYLGPLSGLAAPVTSAIADPSSIDVTKIWLAVATFMFAHIGMLAMIFDDRG